MSGIDYEEKVLKLKNNAVKLSEDVLKSLSPLLLKNLSEFVKLNEEIIGEYTCGDKGLASCLYYKYEFYRRNTINIKEEIAFLNLLSKIIFRRLGEKK